MSAYGSRAKREYRATTYSKNVISVRDILDERIIILNENTFFADVDPHLHSVKFWPIISGENSDGAE